MKSFALFVSALFLLLAVSSTCSAFAPSSSFTGGQANAVVRSTRQSSISSSTNLSMIFGPKDDGSPGDYVCLDCGYVFTKGPDAWKALPNNWSCPPCGSVKRRFKKVPKGSVKDTSGAAEQPKKKGLFGF